MVIKPLLGIFSWWVVTGAMEFDETFQKQLELLTSSQLLLTPSFFRGVAQTPTSLPYPPFSGDFHSGMDDHKPTKTMKRLTRSAHIRWFRGDMIHHSKGIQYDRMGDITNLIQYLGI
jgi:hypothetical protein